MISIWVVVVLLVILLIFTMYHFRYINILHSEVEKVAYGMRGSDNSDENKKTNITKILIENAELIEKLEEIGVLVYRDDTGKMVYENTGSPNA